MRKRTGNTSKEKQPKVTGEWLYLAAAGTTVRQIAEAVGTDHETELWEDAGVLEILFEEKSSMDIEETKMRPGDEVMERFMEENGCAALFLVTFLPEEYARAKVLMKQIIDRCGGLFCGDTEDFTPLFRG